MTQLDTRPNATPLIEEIARGSIKGAFTEAQNYADEAALYAVNDRQRIAPAGENFVHALASDTLTYYAARITVGAVATREGVVGALRTKIQRSRRPTIT